MDEQGHKLLADFALMADGELESFLALMPDPVLLVGPGSDLGLLDEATDTSVHNKVDQTVPRAARGSTWVIQVSKRFSTAASDILWLGRAVTCDVILPFDTVSKIHAVVSRDARDQLLVADVGSKNGTWVNGVALKTGIQMPLNDNDVLRLGTVEMRFLFPESLFLYLQTDART